MRCSPNGSQKNLAVTRIKRVRFAPHPRKSGQGRYYETFKLHLAALPRVLLDQPLVPLDNPDESARGGLITICLQRLLDQLLAEQ